MTADKTRDRIAGVRLSSPDKVLFAEQGVTKADLAAHYERVAERMLPLVDGRLVSLVRCPEGESGQCFFQRHEHKGFPEAIRRVEIKEKEGTKGIYLALDGLASLIAGVQMGTLEFHIWGSRADRIEKPDRLVFDLDPDEGLDFADVKVAAVDIRYVLSELGLRTVPLVTGGKGVHVVAPLTRRAEWPEVKAFARGFAQLLANEFPNRFLAQASKAKREGRIFIDWLRNERSASAIAPYSTRAKKGAPVATPVSWDELKSLQAANTFRIGDMEKRMAKPDPWAEAAGWRQSITGKLLKSVGA
jgi:bifunctional non-homologous end joining protein LigD